MTLVAYLASVDRFDWATANCAHFAAGWLRANGQPDPTENLPATPDRSAVRALVERLGGICAACSRALGRDPIDWRLAQVGDIVLIDIPGGGFTLGICNGRQAACIDAEGGLGWVSMRDATCAWRLKP